ncbi:THO complex subunit 2-like isoform X2 [Watersipora subatra]|uniref:THO complex subunit 2-like isoform X2 n=1 Tax=Watersipora subatra TaxID=2589382 RepID=UPI00355B1C40
MAAGWLSADVCKAWDKSGKIKTLDEYEQLRSQSENWNSPKTSDRLLYEVLHSSAKGSLKISQLISFIRELLKKDASVQQEIVSLCCILDAETKVSQDSLQRRNLICIFKELLTLMPPAIFKEQLDADTLEQIDLVKADDFNKKYIKVKTKLYYKQQKFNLLREESEGYAKLITDVSQELNPTDTISDKLENIKSLIGCFNLDPNRVLDIILQAFENRPDLGEELYVPVLTEYMPEYDSICQMLGFHLKNCSMNTPDDRSHTKRVFDVMAILMKHGLVSLDGIYPHLSPSDADIREQYKKTLSDARSSVRKTRAVHTGEKKEEDKKEGDKKEGEDETAAGEAPNSMQDDNGKLQLTEALLKQGAWKQAKEVMDRLPQYHATSYEPIAKTMCQLIHYVIDPMYQRHHGLPIELFRCKPYLLPYTTVSLAQANSFVDLIELTFPMLRYLGCHLVCDPSLTTKVVRVIKSFLAQRSGGTYSGPKSDLLYRHCLAVVDEVLLPSLCLAEANCCLAEQMWSILQLLPYTLRYQLYGQWKSQSYYMQPELISARLTTLKKAKYIFSRLTKDNVKQQGRMIGKLSHANPAVFFEYMFTQVQVYDNLITPIVDSLKYLSSLSFDVLTYCLIEALAAPDKEKMKYDDTNLSAWLKGLASFAALALKKYQVEYAGLLQYICNQLKAEKSFDLLILREMLTKIGGIEVSEEITEQHMEAMCGGELLRLEGGNFLQTRNVKKPSQRFKETILKHDLATPLAALMAQQRDCIVYKESVNVEHIKLIGKIYDQCQDTFVQYITFLSSVLTIEELSKKLPSLEEMLSVYHIPSDAAFYLVRPMLVHSINLKYETLRKQDKMARDKDKSVQAGDKAKRYIEAFAAVLDPVTERIKPHFEPKMWDELSSTLYTTFWTLSAYDLYVPKAAYEREVNLVKQKVLQLEQEGGRDMRETKKRKEMERYNQMIIKFKNEEKTQADHVSRVIAKLDHDKDLWFKAPDTQKQVERFIQFCIFPRVLHTTVDAFFCAKMIHTMHRLKTPHFGTLIILDRIFNDITYLITCCTENEAHRYGRFLCCILEIVMRWRESESTYRKECTGHPGFVTTFRAGAAGTNHAELSFEDYRHVCHKWQFRMTRAAIACFESGNYTQIRNALIVLTKVLPHFPMIIGVGQALERRVDKVHKEEKEKRPDLYALAMGYAGQLKGRKGHWLQDHVFHYVPPEKLKKKAEAKQAAREAKTESCKSDSVTVVKVVKADSKADIVDHKTSSGSSGSAQNGPKSSNLKSTAAASSKTNKDRAEAAAFLKESKKVDTVELPPSKKVEADAKSDLKTLASSNGVSSKETKGSTKEMKTKRERKDPDIIIKSENSSPIKILEDRDHKRRKVESDSAKNSRSRSSEGKSLAPESGMKRVRSHNDMSKLNAAESTAKSEKRERETPRSSKKAMESPSSEKQEVSKKRRSDVAQTDSNMNSKSDRHKNGGDVEPRPAKRSKDEVREKDRKADKHRSATRKTD